MNAKMKRLLAAILGAGTIIAAALILKYLTSIGYIEDEGSKRLMRISLGILLVVIGNMIPKSAEPLSGGCCEPSREQSLRRFTGWTFVFAGLGFSTVWLFAPIEVASTVSTYIVIASFSLVIVPFVWSVIKRKRLQPSV